MDSAYYAAAVRRAGARFSVTARIDGKVNYWKTINQSWRWIEA
jgi:hypothetical protein